MGVIRETVEKKGVFCSLYVDRTMHFLITAKTRQKPDRTRESQIERSSGARAQSSSRTASTRFSSIQTYEMGENASGTVLGKRKLSFDRKTALYRRDDTLEAVNYRCIEEEGLLLNTGGGSVLVIFSRAWASSFGEKFGLKLTNNISQSNSAF